MVSIFFLNVDATCQKCQVLDLDMKFETENFVLFPLWNSLNEQIPNFRFNHER